MHILRLSQLLRTFRAFGQNGLVYIKSLHDKEVWYAYLLLLKGEVTSSYVFQQDNQQLLYRDAEAIEWLETKEGLFWRVEESSRTVLLLSSLSLVAAHTSQPQQEENSALQHSNPPQPDKRENAFPYVHTSNQANIFQQQQALSTLVPQRISAQRLSSVALNRDSKRVFALIDGQRNTAQIAVLLHCSPQHVVRLLYELQAKGFIEI